MNRNEILTAIFEEMLVIEHIGKGHFKHTQKHILRSLVKGAIARYQIGYEGALDLIRDEIYFVAWKAIKKFENDYTIGELEIILEQLQNEDENAPKTEAKIYLKSIKKYVELNCRNYLLPDSRKDENRQMMDVFTEATDFTGLDYLISTSIDEENKMSHFMEWCLENWQSVLTKKQVEFMKQLGQEEVKELSALDRKNKARREKNMRERISMRLMDKYSKIYDGNRRYNEALGAVHKLEWILEQEDFTKALLDNYEKDYIIAAIYDHVAIDKIQTFNRCVKNGQEVPSDVLKAHRVALFKALKQSYNMVEGE